MFGPYVGLIEGQAMSEKTLPSQLYPRQSSLRGIMLVIGLAALVFGAMWWLS